jgi:hypothetical protein
MCSTNHVPVMDRAYIRSYVGNHKVDLDDRDASVGLVARSQFTYQDDYMNMRDCSISNTRENSFGR